MLLWDGYSSSKGVDSLLLRERNLGVLVAALIVSLLVVFGGLSPSAPPRCFVGGPA